MSSEMQHSCHVTLIMMTHNGFSLPAKIEHDQFLWGYVMNKQNFLLQLTYLSIWRLYVNEMSKIGIYNCIILQSVEKYIRLSFPKICISRHTCFIATRLELKVLMHCPFPTIWPFVRQITLPNVTAFLCCRFVICLQLRDKVKLHYTNLYGLIEMQ